MFFEEIRSENCLHSGWGGKMWNNFKTFFSQISSIFEKKQKQ